MDGKPRPDHAGRECLLLCGKLSACGAAEAADFDGCVADCEQRFESEPQTTAVLCACAEWSSCEDLSNRRCSDLPGPGNGGAAGAGGNGGAGGSTAGGSGGAGGTGGTAGSGGSSAGTAGTGSLLPCGRDCDCPLPDVCVDGVCVAP